MAPKKEDASSILSESLTNLNLFDCLSGYDEETSKGEDGKASMTGSENGKKKKKKKKGATSSVANEPRPAEEDDSPNPLKMPLVWIDLEMTGLDPDKDRILEIACIITDGRLGQFREGPHLVINQSEQLIAGMGQWCQEHHFSSGLVEGVRNSTVTEREAEVQVLEFVKKHCPSSGPAPNLAGNSVHVDLTFLKKYMPDLASYFSHILVDVSSVRALCIRWYPKEANSAPLKKQSHRALDDIRESISQLEYLRRTIFKKQG